MLLNVIISLLLINSLGATLYGIRGLLLGSYTLIYSLFCTIIGIPYTRELSDIFSKSNNSGVEFASTVLFMTIILGTLSGLTYYILGYIIYVKKKIYVNFGENMDAYYRWTWSRSAYSIQNKYNYTFVPTRANKKMIYNAVTSDTYNIDYLKK